LPRIWDWRIVVTSTYNAVLSMGTILMTGGPNFKTLMTLRMPEEGKAGFGLKKYDFPVIFSKTRMMETTR